MNNTVLNPWEELAQVNRPSIFLKDPYFRAKNPSNQIKKEGDLGYKQFGTFTRAPKSTKVAAYQKGLIKLNGLTATALRKILLR